jgi:membrane protein implicated in regulation of membrane protease activity
VGLLFVFGYLFLLISGIAPQLDVWLLGFVPLTPATIVFLVVESLDIVVLITWWERRRSGSR